MNLGDIKLNGKYYRVDTRSYRRRDVVDFSPRAGTPGGSVLYSELGLYQPVLQTDWRHGFGANWYTDAMSYMRTEGNIDTRHEGIAMLFTKPTLSDTSTPSGTNLVSNGTFETGDLTNWTQSAASFSVDTTSPYAGSYSLKTAAITDSGAELLLNGGAENGDFTSWTKTTESAGAWTVVTTTPTPQAGTYCFKWKPTNAINKGILTSDRIAVTAALKYLVSGYIYTLSIPDHAKMEVLWYNDASAGTLLQTDVIGTTAEVQAFVKYQQLLTAPTGALSAAVVLTVTNLSTTTNYAAFDVMSFTAATYETLTSDRYTAVGNKTYEITAYSKDTATTTTTTLQPATNDTYISNIAPTTNYGSATTIGIGKSASTTAINRALIKFLSISDGTIPSKDHIDSAILKLKVAADDATSGGTFNVYRMNKEWDAASANWSWRKYGTSWTTSAGGFSVSDCNQTAIASTVLTQAEAVDSWISWTLDNDMFKDMVDRTWTNYGFLMKTSSESNDRYTFHSCDAAVAGDKPQIEVVHTSYPDYEVSVLWYDAASAGNLIRTDTLFEQNNDTTWNKRTARIVSPSNALSFTIVVTAYSGSIFYLDNIDFHLATGNKEGFFTWNSATWAYGQEGISKYVNGTWTNVYSSAAVNHALPAGDYLFYCPDGARLRKINTSGTDSTAGNDSSSINFGGLIIHSGYIYGWVDGTNQIHRDSTSDMSEMEGTTTDTNIIYVGASNSPIISMIEYAGYLYAGREDGLWQIGEDMVARKMLDFSADASADNFRSMSVFNGYLLFPIRDKMYQWNGARLSDVTPPRLTDSFPYTTYGRFDNFVASGKYLYCTARTNETTYSEDLLCYDGVAWFKLLRLVESSTTDTITALGYDTLNNYLWYTLDSTSSYTYYIPFQSQSSLPYASFSTTTTNELIFSRWDCGYRRVKKSCPSVLIEGSNLSADHYLSLYYALDGGEFVKWGDIKTNGIVELSKPGGNNSVEFYYITFKVTLTTTDETQSPILEGITMRFIMRPETVWGWNISIPIAHNMDIGEQTEGRITKEALDDLSTARDSKSPIEFVDVVGNTYYVYISSMTESLMEFDRTEMGETPGLEYVSTINLVEAK